MAVFPTSQDIDGILGQPDAAQHLVELGKTTYKNAEADNSGTGPQKLKQFRELLHLAEQAKGNSLDSSATTALIAAQKALKGYTGWNLFNGHNIGDGELTSAQAKYTSAYDHRDPATVSQDILKQLQADNFTHQGEAATELAKIKPENLKILDQRLQALGQASGDSIDHTAAAYAARVVNASGFLDDKDLTHFNAALQTLSAQKVNPDDGPTSAITKGLLASVKLSNYIQQDGGVDTHSQAVLMEHATDQVHETGKNVKWDPNAPVLTQASQAAPPPPPPAAVPPPILPAATNIVDKSADNGIALFDSGKTTISGQQEARLRAYMDSKFKGADGKPLSSLKVDFGASADKPGNAKINQEKSDARLKELERIALDEAAKQHVTLTIGHEDSRGSKDVGKSKGPDQMQRRASMVFHP